MQVPPDHYEAFLTVLMTELNVDPLEVAPYRALLNEIAGRGDGVAFVFMDFMRMIARAQHQWECGNCKARFLPDALKAAKGKPATRPAPLLRTGEAAKLRNETEGVQRLCPNCGQNTIRPPGG